MRHPAQRAATLAGRPLFMRESGLGELQSMLGLAPRRASLFGSVAQIFAGRDDDGPLTPQAMAEACVPMWMGEPDDVGCGWVLKDGVAFLDVCGSLWPEGWGWGSWYCHGYDTIRAALEEAEADPRVRAKFIRWQSPGGLLSSGLPELAAYMRETSARNGGKRLIAFCEAAYSAAYWLAAQADEVIAPREGGVGSIGAVIVHTSLAKALEEEGVEVTPIEFPEGKTDGAWFKPLSDSARLAMLAEVRQGVAWFLDDVIAGRPALTRDGLLALNAGTFLGDASTPALSGLSQGLIDRVATERAAFSELAASAGSTPAASAALAAMENDMRRSAISAALKASGLSGAQLALAETNLLAAMAAEDAEAEGEGGDAEASEGEQTDCGEDTADDTVMGGDAEASLQGAPGEDAIPDGATVLAIIQLPEAKGRDKLAQELAATPGMTADRAKKLLTAAPKAAAREATDHNVSGDGGGSVAKGPEAEGRALAAQYKGLRPRHSRR